MKTDAFERMTKRMIDGLKNFSSSINNSHADIFIIMARKAIFLFKLLCDYGWIDESIKKRLIITDRAIDFQLPSLNSMKIAIIDDIVVSGTTIAKTIGKLVDRGANERLIEIIVVAINEDTFNKSFFNDETNTYFLLRHDSYFNFSQDECFAFCLELTSHVIEKGKFYDVDFPRYDSFFKEADSMQDLINTLFFNRYNISNDQIKEKGIHTITLIPNRIFENIVACELGNEFVNAFHIKIRLMVKEVGNYFSIEILPMVMLNETSVDTVISLYDELCNGQETFVFNSEDPEDQGAVAKARFLQFYYAHRIGLIYYKVCKIDKPKIHMNQLEELFGLNCNIYANILSDNLYKIEKFDSGSLDMLNYSEDVNYEYDYNSDYDVSQLLVDVFRKRYNDEEIPAREDMKNDDSRYYQLIRIEKYDRLEKGFSFNAMVAAVAIKKRNEIYDIQNLVSIFLDRAIDNGSIKSFPICRTIESGRKVIKIPCSCRPSMPYNVKQFDFAAFGVPQD